MLGNREHLNFREQGNTRKILATFRLEYEYEYEMEYDYDFSNLVRMCENLR